jgi:glycosyltransferase involved in cell wall biosynthesis
MRATLDPGCSIYEADWVMEYGCEQFLHDIGCSVIHSHGVVGEMFFYRLCEGPLPVPYVATLHGSYEAATSKELPERFIAKIVRNVDLFVYTADKNLAPLLRHDVRPAQLIKMINAMPVDEVPFPRSRADMGIAEDAIVFTLVARGIPEKGWSTAINAFKAVQERNPGRAMHLCLVGEGEEPDRLKKIHANDASIVFLGFQLRIHGLYRMTDVAIVPTRFAGESFPLCIIQALQVSVPVIATDVGEIASMLKVGDVVGGIVVESSRDDRQFDAVFTEAMDSLMDDVRRRRMAADAEILGKEYDMGAFTDQYVALYEEVMHRFAAARSAVPAEPIIAQEGVVS